MSSRVEKYSSNATTSSRQSRNKQLYEDLYSDTSYSNSVVLDDSKTIDIDKIREILENEKKYQDKKKYNPTSDLYADLESISTDADIDRVYDINEVLKSAKSSRDIFEDANEKRKIQSKFYSHIDIEKELEKTKDAYDKLLHEETELLELMNTLTNATKEDLAMSMFSDLTDEAVKGNTVEVKQIEDDKTSTAYNSSTFMFDTKDFDDEMQDEAEEMKKTNTLAKVLIIIFVILFLAAAAFFIWKYILK
ncbi:MAG: hypothetical protein IKZ96_03070 [Bacilli bacterium]|nr:hypothetical protein [Bacilli bacterium]